MDTVETFRGNRWKARHEAKGRRLFENNNQGSRIKICENRISFYDQIHSERDDEDRRDSATQENTLHENRRAQGFERGF